MAIWTPGELLRLVNLMSDAEKMAMREALDVAEALHMHRVAGYQGNWVGGTEYVTGDTVLYNGVIYRYNRGWTGSHNPAQLEGAQITSIVYTVTSDSVQSIAQNADGNLVITEYDGDTQTIEIGDVDGDSVLTAMQAMTLLQKQGVKTALFEDMGITAANKRAFLETLGFKFGFARDRSKDISLGVGSWQGITWDGTSVLVVDSMARHVRAWTNGQRDTSKDISLGIGVWQGITWDGTSVLVVETGFNLVRAWTNGVRDTSKDINLGTGAWTGLTWDGTSVLVVDSRARHVRAWTNGQRDTSKDISLGVGSWQGITWDGTSVLALEDEADFVRVWTNGSRDVSKDISLDAGDWRGITWDGTSVLVVDTAKNSLKAWTLSPLLAG